MPRGTCWAQDSPRNPLRHLRVIRVDEITMNTEAAAEFAIGLEIIRLEES
jgi:hypothetical protein